jgi:hypothetical protein
MKSSSISKTYKHRIENLYFGGLVNGTRANMDA